MADATPVVKKGSVQLTSNYRSISLPSVVDKQLYNIIRDKTVLPRKPFTNYRLTTRMPKHEIMLV